MHGEFCNLGGDTALVSFWRMRSIVQRFFTSFSETLKLLVTGLLAYSEFATDISDSSLSIRASSDRGQLL
jgi:hypothetical protein